MTRPTRGDSLARVECNDPDESSTCAAANDFAWLTADKSISTFLVSHVLYYFAKQRAR